MPQRPDDDVRPDAPAAAGFEAFGFGVVVESGIPSSRGGFHYCLIENLRHGQVANLSQEA